jgi:hypothetical protein
LAILGDNDPRSLDNYLDRDMVAKELAKKLDTSCFEHADVGKKDNK